MYTKEKIKKAIRIHKLGYQFLMYLTNKIDKNKFVFSKSHNEGESTEVIYTWIKDYYDYLPKSILPEKDEIRDFSNYFTSYLTTSFELVEKPQIVNKGSDSCFCNVCLQFTNVSHLKSISPRNHDRDIADQMRSKIVAKIAQSEGITLSDKACDEIANTHQYIRDTAYLAYTKALFHRIETSEGGIYILALWRQFAWNKEGSPIHGFELKVEDILKAQENLKSRITKK